MRPLLVALAATTILTISILFADDARPSDPLDAAPAPRPIDEIFQYLDEQIALS